jgi:kynurenine formamidase
VLLHGRLLKTVLHRLDIGGNVQRFDIGDATELVFIAPGEEPTDSVVVGHAGVLVADGGGEKFQEAPRRLVAGVGDDRRYDDLRRDSARDPRRLLENWGDGQPTAIDNARPFRPCRSRSRHPPAAEAGFQSSRRRKPIMADHQRWTRRPPGSTWGDWGPDDERGRLNLLTPEKVLQGVAEVKTGKTFCLSLPLDYPGGAILSPRRHPPVLKPTMRGDKPNMNYPLRCDDPTATDIVCDDQVVLTLQYSTQWDSLAHVGQMFDADGDGKAEDVFYNGYRAGRDIIGPAYYDEKGNMTPCDQPQGARHLGVQNMAESCMQGRGVMIDLEANFGRSGRKVSYEDLMEVMRKDGVVVEPGDFVLFRTGFDQMLLDMGKQPDRETLFSTSCALDGRDARLQQWVTDSGTVALISDHFAVEAMPASPCMDDFCATLPLHAHCLFRLGCYLGEMFYLTPLADWLRANGRNRFLFTGPPLRLPGAVGSPATPVATV